jgi:hypothetical protein
MKDRSRVDALYAAALMVVMGLSLYSVSSIEPENLALSVGLLFVVNGFLVSIYIYNQYEITHTTLNIRFGPLKETIPLDKISEVRIVKNYWSSMALARRRILIRYWYKGKFLTTTYISPMQLEPFLEELVRRSNNIQDNYQ